MEARMSEELEMPSLRMAIRYNINHGKKLTKRLEALLETYEVREEPEKGLEKTQNQRKERIDRTRKLVLIKTGD